LFQACFRLVQRHCRTLSGHCWTPIGLIGFKSGVSSHVSWGLALTRTLCKMLPELGLVSVISLVTWVIWHVLVIMPATRKSKLFGPRWLSNILVDVAWFWARRILCVPFSTNLEDATRRGVLTRQAMVVFHPHGAFCGMPLFYGGRIWQDLSTAKRGWYVCIADLLFRFPGLSEFLIVNNCRAADKNTMSELLAKGHCAAVQPGGIFEQIRWNPDSETAYFPKNLGFIRLALQHGVPLLPLYFFGENQLFTQNVITRAVNGFLNRTFGVGVFCVLGYRGLPWLWPRTLPVTMVWGDLVEVGEAVKDPSDARIQEVFKLYTAALRKLWDEHAARCLPPDVAQKGLTIVWRGHDAEL